MNEGLGVEAASRRLARILGPVGVHSSYLHKLRAARAAEVLAEVESAGVGAVWFGEGAWTKEAMSHAAVLLATTRRLVVATGVAAMQARDAVALAAGARVLAEAYPDRFVLGIGVSHAQTITERGHDVAAYDRPLTRMRRYLDDMDAAQLMSPAPANPPPRLLAALRPRMLRLAAERTLGAHPFFVTVDHIARARDMIGPAPVLAPEVAVVLEADRRRARKVAVEHVAHRLERQNYRNHLLHLGFTEDDLDHGGSDRLFDAVIAWGDVDAIAQRVRDYREAGADHVAIGILARHGEDFPLEDFGRLAPVLLGDVAATVGAG